MSAVGDISLVGVSKSEIVDAILRTLAHVPPRRRKAGS
jgi:hypothetical protein